MPRSLRAAAAVRLTTIGLTTFALVAKLPSVRATAPGITYTERHVQTMAESGSVGRGGASMVMTFPRTEYTERVTSAGGRIRRELVAGDSTRLYKKGEYNLSDNVNGSIIVHPVNQTFSVQSFGLTTTVMSMGGVRAMPTQKDVSVTLDTLGAGDVIDGHPTTHYRLTVSFTMVLGGGGGSCGTGPQPGSGASAGPTEVTHMTYEYWLARGDAFPAEVRTQLGLGHQSGSVDVGVLQLELDAGARWLGDAGRDLGSKMELAMSRLPTGSIPLRMVVGSHIGGIASGIQMTSTDSTETTAIKSVDVDLTQLVLPPGYVGAPTMSAADARGRGPGGPPRIAPPEVVAKWQVMPSPDAATKSAGAASALSRAGAPPPSSGLTRSSGAPSLRTFTISPALAGKTTWNLDADGPLDIGTPGTWTLTAQASFTAAAHVWGGGGGGPLQDGGLGGGGGYSEGTLSFQRSATYTIVVGAGGQGSTMPGCGGNGGLGGGGAGGGVQAGGGGSPGTPYAAGGSAHQGRGRGNGSGGGGGGLSGIFTTTMLSHANALLIAGGGGGATFGATNGGAGGGTTGDDGAGSVPGTAGTSSSGGAPGTQPGARLGAALGVGAAPGSGAGRGPAGGVGAAGGPGGAGTDSLAGATGGGEGFGGGGAFAAGQGAGGGGGSGYFGGGGGGQNRGGGGGGSGFVGAGVTRGSTKMGEGPLPANNTDPRIGGAGAGATSGGEDGAPGRVIILP